MARITPTQSAFVSLAIVLAVMIALMFGAAGTLDWPQGWMFFGFYCVVTALACLWLWRTNPEIFAARSKMQEGTKSWDKALTGAIVLVFLAIFAVCGYDFRESVAQAPGWGVMLGFVLFAAGFFGFTWATSVNRHFEATVRIQTDRDHRVITTGPYAFVRHPGYSLGIVMVTGMPLAMGSLLGLVPAGVLGLLVLVRTLAEDATLKAELPGYTAYAARVKQRWIPGVW
jgi:protein-S-isoprenylcysteine O-methyltransferase Ste14